MMLMPLILIAANPVGNAAQQGDLGCIAALSWAAGTLPETERNGVAAGVMYFLGRVEGREPAIDLEASLTQLVADEKAFAAKLPKELKRCGGEMEIKGAALQKIGAALQQRGASSR